MRPDNVPNGQKMLLLNAVASFPWLTFCLTSYAAHATGTPAKYKWHFTVRYMIDMDGLKPPLTPLFCMENAISITTPDRHEDAI